MKSLQGFLLVVGALVCWSTVGAQQKMTRSEYINKYKKLAVESMEVYGIPASVKMAQALLESMDGNSEFARRSNNHFGIKCKNDWKGETVTHDDDEKGECFRKYPSVEESYRDHSEFIDRSVRYNALFDLDPKDYIGWAKGLKQAGYATNPKYAEQLIQIIEDNKLYLLDDGLEAYDLVQNGTDQKVETKPEIPVKQEIAGISKPADPTTNHLSGTAGLVDVDNYVVGPEAGPQNQIQNRMVQYNNGVAYVVTGVGDTFERLAGELKISLKKLLEYNDLASVVPIHQGDALYIRPKKKRAENGKYAYNAKPGDTMHQIAQQHGIRLKNLYQLNFMEPGDEPTSKQVIRLL